jgi:hypothetical protein
MKNVYGQQCAPKETERQARIHRHVLPECCTVVYLMLGTFLQTSGNVSDARVVAAGDKIGGASRPMGSHQFGHSN